MKTSRTWTWCATCEAHFDTSLNHEDTMTRQTELPGHEDPNRSPEIDRQIEAWYAARSEQKLAAERTSVTLAKLLELCEDRERYPFLEPGTGRRKVLDVTAQRKLRVKRAPSAKQEQADREWEAAQAEERGGEAAARDAYVTTVLGGHADPRPVPDDPFSATRSRMTGDVARGAAIETSAQIAARESEEARAARRANGRRVKP